MAQVRDIKRRIKSVENTKQITRAMKMVAAAKLRRAQDRMLSMRPYAERVNRALRYLAVDLVGDEHPLFASREVKRAATVVIAGDRGLCGGFNTNVVRAANRHFAAHPACEHVLFAIGKRAISALRKGERKILKSYFEVFENLSFILAGEICEQLVGLYMTSDPEKRIDEAYVVYNEFVSAMTQKQVVKRILPVDFKELAAERRQELETAEGSRPIYEIEPDVETVVARLVRHRMATQVYHATLESYAAELSARMTAMDNATTNAEDMIERLTLDFNRARQSGITAELLDIVGGANALA